MKKAIFISIGAVGLAILVTVATILILHRQNNNNEITLYGNVDVRQVDIGFRISGQVNHLVFEEGDEVRSGDLMCCLDQSPYNSQLMEALAVAEAIKVELKHAQILLDRRCQLITSGGVSQEDLEDAQANYERLCANLAKAEASVAVARDNMSFTQAYAPTDGIILTRIREAGTIVAPTDPVYTLSVSSPVWIRAFVDEVDLGKVYYGMKAEVFTDSGRSYLGQIGFISPVAEFTPKTVETSQLRTDLVYRLRIYIENIDRGLVQGMPVTVKLKLGP